MTILAPYCHYDIPRIGQVPRVARSPDEDLP